MSIHIKAHSLTAQALAPYGDVMEALGTPDQIINQGKCGRFHDKARLDFSDGRAGVSIFHSALRSLPLRIEMVEQHPLGSQAFVPMSADPFLIVVARDEGGVPQDLKAFLTEPGQAINVHKGTWHGVLTPLSGSGLFAVIDRIGDGDNLKEHWFDTCYIVEK